MLRKISILLLLAVAFYQPATFAQYQPADNGFGKFQHPGGPLPQLKIVTSNQQVYTKADFKTKNHFFLIMFNPTCPHCINETKMIVKNEALFQNTKVAFMAPRNEMSFIKSFLEKTDIGKYPQFIVGVDSVFAVDKLYTPGRNLPQINIYDSNFKLEKIYHGDIPIDSLKQYLP